jgi:transposase
MQRTSWRLIQAFCQSGWHLPISLGAGRKVIDRASPALVPHYAAIATLARQATGGYIDATPWYGHNAWPWRWTLTTDPVSRSLMHPHRSKAACVALLEEWQGILGSDGYGVYQNWGHERQPCLAHLLRTVRGVSENRAPELAAGGAWALKELRRLCHMATAPPTGGEGRAWDARFCPVIDRYHERAADAGRLASRWQRELASLWVCLFEPGVEPTNNRAERALRLAVLWRKSSHGTASRKGNEWVERRLSRRQTARQLGQSTCGVVVDAVTSLVHGRQPELAWLY